MSDRPRLASDIADAHRTEEADEPFIRPPTVETECDECGQSMIPNVTSALVPEGERWSFACPHCQREYPVCLITRRGLELRKRLRKLRAELADLSRPLLALEHRHMLKRERTLTRQLHREVKSLIGSS